MAALKLLVSAVAAWLASSEGQEAAELIDMALPDVDFFMKEAQDPLKEFGDQAEQLKKEVAQSEKEETAAVAKMKAAFEQNLTQQDRLCNWFVEESAKLTAAIAKQDEAILELRQDAKMVEKSNDIMRTALNSLRPKMRLASSFLWDSINNATDASNASELDVLRPTTPAPTLEQFLNTMGRGRKVSLLELDVQPAKKAVKLNSHKPTLPEAKPEELVGTLAQRLQDLKMAGDDGEFQLQARFLADYELGEKKHIELLKHKEALEEEHTQKEALRAQLVAVKAHLVQIRSQLMERVQGVRQFADNGQLMTATTIERAAAAAEPSTH